MSGNLVFLALALAGGATAQQEHYFPAEWDKFPATNAGNRFSCVTRDQEEHAAAFCYKGQKRYAINDGPTVPKSLNNGDQLRLQGCWSTPVEMNPKEERCTWLQGLPQRMTHAFDFRGNKVSVRGMRRMLESLEMMMSDIAMNGIAGDIMQTGVYIGVMDAMLASSLKAHGEYERTHWLCDSFKGMPPPTAKFAADAGNTYFEHTRFNIGVETPQENFRRLGILGGRLKQEWVVGFFNDTMPGLIPKVAKLALLRLDADLYQPTWEVLMAMYNKVSIGGYIVLDDMHLHKFTAAVTDFRKKYGITEPVYTVMRPSAKGAVGSWWKKMKEVNIPMEDIQAALSPMHARSLQGHDNMRKATHTR